MNYEKVRGTKQDIGEIEIAIPGTVPMTDGECLELEDRIGKIDRYLAPYEEIVKDGKAVIAGMRDDITVCRNIMARAREKVDPRKFPLHAEWIRRENEAMENAPKAIAASATVEIVPVPAEPLQITSNAGKRQRKRRVIEAAAEAEAEAGGATSKAKGRRGRKKAS